MGNVNTGTNREIYIQPDQFLYIIVQRPVINRAPIDYLNELEISFKITFKDLCYQYQLIQPALGYSVIRNQAPAEIPIPTVDVSNANITGN